MNEQALEITNLSKIYRGGPKAVANLSLNINMGEVFGLLGPNGAGKTTLMLTVLGLLNRDQGEIKIFGKGPEDFDIKRRISYLPENPSFNFPRYLTAYEYLEFHADLKKIPDDKKREQIAFLLNNLDLINRKDDRISKFSKGMLQRLNIAQAFLGDPDFLFLDEPILGLDPVGVAKVRELILLYKKKGKTFFINSHMLSEVEKTCDHFGIMINGHLEKVLQIEDLASSMEGVVIKISNLEEIKDAIKHLGEIDGKTLKVIVKNESDIEAVSQEIFKKGGKITSIVPQFKDLEQFFIDVLKKDELVNH